MLVAVRYHNRTRETLRQLRARLGATEEQRDRRFERLIDVIAEHFVRCDGLPPEATPEPGPGSIYWLAFGTNLLLQFVVREQPPPPRGWWDVFRRLARRRRGVTREVLVIGLLPVTSAVEAPPPDSSTAPG